MTTEELIAEIERLDAAATIGPWRVDGTIRRDGKGRPNLPAYIEVELSAEDSATIIEVWDKDEDAELIASYRTLAVEAARRLREAEKDKAFYKDAATRQNFEIEQILGKALGYPTFDTLPEIGGTTADKDIVFVFMHTAESIAEEAATRLRELTDAHGRLQSLVGNPDWHRQMAASLDFFENGGEGKTLADLGLE